MAIIILKIQGVLEKRIFGRVGKRQSHAQLLSRTFKGIVKNLALPVDRAIRAEVIRLIQFGKEDLIDDSIVEILAAQIVVTLSIGDDKNAVLDLDDRSVERATTEIEHEPLAILDIG